MAIPGVMASFVVFIPVKISEKVLIYVYKENKLLDLDGGNYDLFKNPTKFMKVYMVAYHVMRYRKDYFSSSSLILI